MDISHIHPPSPSRLKSPSIRSAPAVNMVRSPPLRRTSSRLSLSSRSAGVPAESKASDEDLRTAVKVAIRVRPRLEPSDPGYDLIPSRFRASTCEVTSPTNLTIQSAQGKKLFVFDRVFGPEVNQEGVWDYLSDCVDSFVQGYNVSLLAYGQSGAGKSFTMGTASDPEDQLSAATKGVVPRAATALFERLTEPATVTGTRTGLRTPQRYSTHDLSSLRHSRSTAQLDKDWQLKATYVEIYNEQLRDLLVSDAIPLHERAQVSIREDTKGRILLTGLTQVDINSVEDLLNALDFGSAVRQTDATAINAKSSRSHAVFSLNLVRRKQPPSDESIQDRRRSVQADNLVNESITTNSKLHFVDLAGSERLKNTGAQGERAREGISINAGLASLGKVISQLSSRQSGSHVSYRDSRLTRLLQDSLGGNAITYMIACVTPAEFHLSETLNTVHYAQRARAIQSRPEIQQSSDDGDKNAKIERLQAEITFLRDQINNERIQKHSSLDDTNDNRKMAELQNQLLDMQESYSALNQRHARLIAELGQQRGRSGSPADTPALDDALGGAAVDRLARSNSFAQAVEQIVSEYEKTIQSLETSLLNTRSSLSSSESSLMEKDSRIAHMENVAQGLQARIHKMTEREANNEAYLRDVEHQLEGANSNEVNSSSLVKNLRKELNRAKESQSSSEDYISTLEERLAEAEQDHEILKRELGRLEQVVERQRSIGKLDNLLSDLETIRQSSTSGTQAVPKNRYHPDHDDPFGVQVHTPPSPLEPEMLGLGIDHNPNDDSSPVSPLLDDEVDDRQRRSSSMPPHRGSISKSHPVDRHFAQSKILGDKLETLTQELFDLRGEHESTISDYNDLQRKYTIALQSLTRVNATVDGEHIASGASAPRENAFLDNLSEEAGLQARPDSSDSASLVHLSQPPYLSSSQQDSSTTKHSEGSIDPATVPLPPDTPLDQSVILDQLAYNKHADLKELNQKNLKLAKAHSDALLHIERLKLELQKSRVRTPSPTRKSPLLRRKPSVDAILSMGNVDRANRAFASLRNIALDYFESNIDVRQNFELQLNTIMTELHSRTEKLQGSDAELVAMKKQVEDKATIIAGLTRERTTFKAASTVDFSVVGQMQDQLMESEHQIRLLQKSHASRETDLHAEIDGLKARLGNKPTREPQPHDFDITTDETTRLRGELSTWQDKHNKTVESMKASESQLLATISGLEATLESMRERAVSSTSGNERDGVLASDGDPLNAERAHHDQIVSALRKELEQHKAAGEEHTQKLSLLQDSHARILRQVEETTTTAELNEQELSTHRNLVANLEGQLEAHKSTIVLHEQNLEALQTSHTAKLQELQAHSAVAERKSNERYQALRNEHNHAIEELETEMRSHQEAMAALLAGAAAALGHETSASQLEDDIQAVVGSQQNLEARQAQFANDKATMQEELATVMASNAELQTRVSELKKSYDEAKQQIARISKREEMSARLVQELEDQLHSNFDQSQSINRRMSSIHSEKQLQLDEALNAKAELEKEVEDHRRRMSYLEAQIADLRRRSGTPTLRDSTALYRDSLSPEAAAIALARSNSNSSASHMKSHLGSTALPSPPPAGPLPPLPGSGGSAGVSPMLLSGIDMRTGSPLPGSRPVSGQVPHASLDGGNLAHVMEEQESRIRTVEKHLYAEKQLTATLEEALVDLETAQNRTRSEVDAWRKKASALEDELIGLRKERSSSRASVQQIEEEREMRMRAEQARMALESRMRELNAGKKKKKGTLNCF